MTTKNKIYARYRTKWLIPLRRHENAIINNLLRVFKKEYSDYAENYENILRDGGIGILQKLELQLNVKNILIDAIKKIIPFAGQMVYRDINREIKSDFDYGAYITEYVATEIFRQSIESIVTTFYDDISAIVTSGIAKELTRREISNEILQLMAKKSRYRADTIAITETHRASSYASEKRALDMQKDLGVVMYKDWIPVQDARTRSAHSAMAGVDPIPLNDMFNVGGEKMSRPNDPRSSARNTIRCRCVLRYIVKD
jgi:Phage Mu protein F like protein